MRRSIVQDLGVDKSGCGYCSNQKVLSNVQEEHNTVSGEHRISKRRRPKTRVAHGIWAHQLTVEDYEELMTRGWRRSGKYIYRPDNAESCCQQFVIRLEADKFTPNKSQRRVLKKMDKVSSSLSCFTSREYSNKLSCSVSFSDQLSKQTVSDDPLLKQIRHKLCQLVTDMICEEAVNWGWKVWYNTKNSERLGKCCYSSNLILVLAKHQNNENDSESENPETATLVNMKHKRQVKFTQWRNHYSSKLKEAGKDAFAQVGIDCSVTPNGFIDFWREDDALYQRHNCFGMRPSDRDGINTGMDKVFSHKITEHSLTKKRLRIVMELPKLEDESFLLFQRYQQAIHHESPEESNKESFSRFLVESPLIFVEPNNDSTTPSCGFGTFHMKYYLDERLLAIGVVDVLPHYLSSVYFFYDPSYSSLSLGVYSALHEIEWVRTQCLQGYSSMQYYCMGFYIHNCPKMRYKGDYFPSQLRCEVTGQWIQLEVAQKVLDKQNGRALRLAPEEFPIDEKYLVAPCERVFALLSSYDKELYLRLWEAASKNVPLLFSGKLFVFDSLKRNLNDKMSVHIQSVLLSYIAKVGPHLSVQMIYLL
ncbi:arginine-tRNA-protein transferase [Galdieria sulphuraria]|uniref:Arginyl-tRNA--protein transferase 1 n=1 Tax=Galdieria sulphuraria TaxID=130081 RepID=M2W9F1_GALSU|nr:arginine-tRNA-protein transferase [Galdieria sulphuraria]EME32511.1 arginine-tRNA-protein transferase [Galdieria sulphuraria]|eukprot:XP_005709031.1 arginine-tRNA-protein transferase [Galdieria sulphuraria]